MTRTVLPAWLGRVADELNALLWEPPFMNGAATDLGWACRDHAALLGGCLLAEGREVSIIDGNNIWVHSKGPSGPSRGLGQAPDEPISHTWISVAGVPLDISARLTRTVVPNGGVFPGIAGTVRRLDEPPVGIVVLHPQSRGTGPTSTSGPSPTCWPSPTILPVAWRANSLRRRGTRLQASRSTWARPSTQAHHRRAQPRPRAHRHHQGALRRRHEAWGGSAA